MFLFCPCFQILATWPTHLPWICSGIWPSRLLVNLYSVAYISRAQTFQFLSLLGLSANSASLHFLADCSFSRWCADGRPSLLQVDLDVPTFKLPLEFPGAVGDLFSPVAVAPKPAFICSDSRFVYLQRTLDHNLWLSALLFRPMPVLSKLSVADSELVLTGYLSPDRSGIYGHDVEQNLSALLAGCQLSQFGDQGVLVPKLRDLVWECGKMRLFAQLLRILKAQGHRVLVYSQMTAMLDILQDFLTSNNYTYVRLDGSSSLDQRRSVVDRFQNKYVCGLCDFDGIAVVAFIFDVLSPNVFVFLLSTRAGGLGINLVAADTVIFYDNDWNPTMDSQAMDRAHRLGQTRPVTVYRLVTRHTVEERILERAKQKARIQSLVIGGGKVEMSDEGLWQANEMAELLMEDDDRSHPQSNRKRYGFLLLWRLRLLTIK